MRPVCALLYADDAAIICNCKKDAQKALFELQHWTVLNGLDINVQKCGVMSIGSGSQDGLCLKYGNATIPVVDQYTYLGTPFHRSLDPKTCISLRLPSLAPKINAIRSFVSRASNPFLAKITLLKSVVVPAITFGGEVFGMSSKAATSRLETLLNNVLRSFTKGWGVPPVATIRADLGVAPVRATMAGSRIRASVKLSSSNTYISSLLAFPPPNARSRSWVAGTVSWCRSNCPSILADSSSHRLAVLDSMTPRQARSAVIASVAESSDSTSKGLIFYQAYDMGSSRRFLDDAVMRRVLCFGHGISGLLALRCGGFWSATRVAALKMIHPKFLNICPCCNVHVAESSAHMLLDCAAWNAERSRFLQPLIQALPSSLSTVERVALLCGGTAGGESTATFRQNWWKSSEGSAPLYIRVASFLNAIFKDRAARVWHSSSRSQGPQGGWGP